jgi:hypothetical protein
MLVGQEGLDWINLTQDGYPAAGYFEYGNETSGFIKGGLGDSLARMGDYYLLKKRSSTWS